VTAFRGPHGEKVLGIPLGKISGGKGPVATPPVPSPSYNPTTPQQQQPIAFQPVPPVAPVQPTTPSEVQPAAPLLAVTLDIEAELLKWRNRLIVSMTAKDEDKTRVCQSQIKFLQRMESAANVEQQAMILSYLSTQRQPSIKKMFE